MALPADSGRRDVLLVFGGGRWARLIVQVLCDITDVQTQIIVVTPRNLDGMRAWVDAQGLGDRVNVGCAWPESDTVRPKAAIVANAVSDHAGAIRLALEHDCHVLAEKPVTARRIETQEVAALAQSRGLLLCAAHVFLYAAYLDKLADAVSGMIRGAGISVEWADPAGETRCGENKQYDAATPVIVDVFPHVISILERIHSGGNLAVRDLTFERGGARVVVTLGYADCDVTVTLERNAAYRKRVLTIDSPGRSWVLDFSVEPGRLRTGEGEESGDARWPERPSPMTQLLASFLDALDGGEPDPRLGIRLAVAANRAADDAMATYRAQRHDFLKARIGRAGDAADRAHLRYALAEMLLAEERLPAEVLERKLAWLEECFHGPRVESLRRAFADEPESATIARLAAEVE